MALLKRLVFYLFWLTRPALVIENELGRRTTLFLPLGWYARRTDPGGQVEFRRR